MKKIILFFLVSVSVFAQNDYQLESYFEKREPSLKFILGIDTLQMNVYTVVLKNHINQTNLVRDVIIMNITSPIHSKNIEWGLGIDYDNFQPEVFRIIKHGSCIMIGFKSENETYESHYVVKDNSIQFEKIEKVPPE